MTPVIEPREITYVSSGITFVALEWGPVNGPLALCLHGYPDTAWTWRHLGPHLAELGWRVVAPFTRGYGPTGLATDGCYQIGALAHDVIAAHAALGADGRAVLIGHDWGAMTAYAAVSHSPELFARTVGLGVAPLMAISGLGGGARAATSAMVRQARSSWYLAFQQLPWIPERVAHRLIPRLWAEWSPGYDATEDVARVLTSLAGPGHASAAFGYYRAAARPWRHSPRYAVEQRHWLGTPSGPLLYLHGADDTVMRLYFAQRAAEALPPGTMEVVAAAGHFLQLEQPELVNKLIAEFVGDAILG